MADAIANRVAIVGRACRLPGASDVAAFWDLLDAARCAVRPLDSTRWSQRRFWHPRRPVAGKTYALAAGLIDDPFAFDPGVFGISPREAEQMDPQQRLALELVWEALEDAGIAPAAIAGSATGVFAGASALDYAGRLSYDIPSLDPYFATGNALSIISNRVSYIFDLRGPSFTVDTACSSALVAFNEAVEALNAGRIDTAVVLGVNLLLSPVSFVGFAQANMLSAQGLCRAFDARADGYVRAEGGVAFVLERADRAAAAGRRAHAAVVASGSNQDGRTIGMSFPSMESQIALLRQIYDGAADPERLAFIEAHGTGTKAGDPVEARAVGTALAQRRERPLPIGSAKSNVGHLEPASGLVGLLKAMLALEHDRLPPTLHVTEINPDIPFGELNLSVASTAVELPRRPGLVRLAGINSFGFGGTNAHVVIGDPDPSPVAVPTPREGPTALVLSASSREALDALVRRYDERLVRADAAETRRLAAAAAHRRARLEHRVVLEMGEGALALRRRLGDHLAGRRADGIATGESLGRDLPVAFVYTGNGANWAGMGRAFLATDAAFRRRFEEVDRLFRGHAGWSLLEALEDSDLTQRMRRAEVAQPLLFALQTSATHALAEQGLVPAVVFGHSVGEIAAAAAAGALSLDDAVAVIHARSIHQESARGAGTMAAVRAAPETARELIADPRCAGLELAAVNSRNSVTISGSHEAIEALVKIGRERRLAVRALDLDYPFHSALIEPVREPLLEALSDLRPQPTRLPFLSTVEGRDLPGQSLDAAYWWRNVRAPVQFAAAADAALDRGVRLFLEIGPRAILQAYLRETLADREAAGAVLAFTYADAPDKLDPIRLAVGEALAHGAAVDVTRFVGAAPRGAVAGLPRYPWQRRRYVVQPTLEATDIFGLAGDHPLIGARTRRDVGEWFIELDPALVPELADHRVSGNPVVPGAALIEMALAAGRDMLGSEMVELTDFEIVHALALDADALRELQVRYSAESRTVEILSRPRLHGDAWITHAAGRVAAFSGALPASPAPAGAAAETLLPGTLYGLARRHGLDFGPRFQRMASVDRIGRDRLQVRLTRRPANATEGYGLDPTELDGTFQSLIALFSGEDSRSGVAFLPSRFGSVRLYQPGRPVHRGLVDIRRAGARSLATDVTLLADDGSVVAELREGRFRASTLLRPLRLARAALRIETDILHDEQATAPAIEATPAELAAAAGVAIGSEPAEDALLLDAFAAAAAERALRAVSRDRRRFDLDALVRQHRIAPEAQALAARLVEMLADQDRVVRDGDGWQFDAAKRPRAEMILAGVLADFPERGAEAVLGARAAALLERALTEGPAVLGAPYSAATLAHAETASPAAEARIAAVDAMLERMLVSWPVNRPLRVLELAAGAGGLTRRLARRLGGPALSLIVTDPDAATVDRLALGFAGTPGIAFQHLDPLDPPAALPPHDIVVTAGGLGRALRAAGAVASLAGALTPGARLIAADPRPSAFQDLVFGLLPEWFARSATPEFPLSLLRDGEEWRDELADAGFVAVAALPLAGAAGSLVTATVPAHAGAPAKAIAPRRAIVLPGHERRDRAWAAALVAGLEALGRPAALVEPLGTNGRSHPAEQLTTMLAGDVDVIHLAGAWSAAPGPGDLVARANALRILLPAVHAAGSRLWVIAPGALQGGAGGPTAAGLMTFARVAANEYRGLDLRVVDVDPALGPSAAPRIAREIAEPREDREIVVAPADIRAPRVRIGLPPARAEGAAMVGRRIALGAVAGLDELAWEDAPLTSPGPGEVAIDVAATGLNFRDVMWAMGLLPDEALEDGFAGPTLGLEAAGTVAAVGKGVKGFAVGDRVIGFVAGGFATRLVTPAAALAPMPKDLSFEAAATIPVAFLTAFYALVELGKIKKGERVLIHGGAGGVGLAALQIAKWRGAEIIATAGAPEKRDFLRALGADHVLGDRDLGFGDAVLALTKGEGVDVVLNSLSGDAMEASLRLVKPFGRFLELGKRDYYANTRLGLRPFRRNVSYFGIDADQLFAQQPDYAAKVFRRVAALFDKNVLSPLPYRRFEAADVVEAFRLMQQSGHVGKIVVAPPPAAPARAAAPFRVAADGTHLVTGGFSGFGLATARWLVQRGAKNLVLLGRRGPAGAEAETALAAFAAEGVRVHAAACDVADAAALAAVLADVRQAMPPLRGVVHAAMVLDDGLLANLDYERLAAVIVPKVAGAENLDGLTRDDPLDYFLMYSSATTFVGNPGQANYVAANGYLEGVARRRRAEGRPALAIAWGALGDVGYLARQEAVREKLGRRVGHHAIPAADALEAVGRLLAEATLDPAGAVVAVAPFDWATARRELAVLGSPTYREVLHGAETGAADAVETVDLAALVAGKDPREARSAVAGLLAGEVARILKLPSSDVDPSRPLTQIGMDSLTALELRLNVERRFGIEMPLVAISDETTLASIAAGIVSRLAEGTTDRQSREDLLARQHVGDQLTVEDLAPLQEVALERQAAVGRVIG